MKCVLMGLTARSAALAFLLVFNSGNTIRQYDSDDRSRRSPNYAYVTMASVSESNEEQASDILWSTITLAHSLQASGSKYPLLVLTDATHLPSGVEFDATLQRLNAQALPLEKVPLPKTYESKLWLDSWKVAWHKLAIWNMTEFDKLVWMDSDGMVARDLDWLFDLSGTWAQNDRFTNAGNAARPRMVCSGVLVLQPSREIYADMLKFADTLGRFPGGDQFVIDRYFKDKRGEPVGMLDPWVADFGWSPFMNFKATQLQGCERCEAATLPAAIAEQYESSVLIPAFVHKSDTWDRCFRWSRMVNGQCGLPLYGDFWRANFCAANTKAGLAGEGSEQAKIDKFCKDVSASVEPLPSPAVWPVY